jgi:hypothetical protein
MGTGRKVINLYRQDGAWWVDFVDDEEVQALFGTTEIMTPFFSSTPEEEVREAIQQGNPDYLILVERG